MNRLRLLLDRIETHNDAVLEYSRALADLSAAHKEIEELGASMGLNVTRVRAMLARITYKLSPATDRATADDAEVVDASQTAADQYPDDGLGTLATNPSDVEQVNGETPPPPTDDDINIAKKLRDMAVAGGASEVDLLDIPAFLKRIRPAETVATEGRRDDSGDEKADTSGGGDDVG